MNNMKRVLFLFLTFLAFTAYGQDDKRSQIQAMKTAYITEELQLTAIEAEKFWPVYNAYRKDLWSLRHDKYSALYCNRPCSLDGLDHDKAMELLTLAKQKELEEMALYDEFQTDLLKVMPAPKVFMLREVEEGFKRKLLHWYSQNKE